MSRRYSNPSGRRGDQGRICACGTPTQDGAYICPGCLEGLAQDLRELAPSGDDPGLWLSLRSVIAGERGIDYRTLGGSSGGTVETGLVLDERAVGRAAALVEILRRLVIACGLAKIEHNAPDDWTPRASDKVLADIEWLSWRIDGMAWHPMFTKAPKLIERATDAARLSVMPAPRGQWLGQCPTTGCDGTMRAARDETFAACTTCGATLEAQPLREWLISHLVDELCTAAEIAELYDPEAATRTRVRKRLNQWASRVATNGDVRLLGWPRLCDWTPGVCAWPAERQRGRNLTKSTEPIVFRFGDAFDLLIEHDNAYRARSSA